MKSEKHLRFIEGREKIIQSEEVKKAKKQQYDKKLRSEMSLITCLICFGVYTKDHKNRHEKSKQHLDAVRYRTNNIIKDGDFTICQICYAPYIKQEKYHTTRHNQSSRHKRAECIVCLSRT